jgi:hypothetical protein
MLHPAGSGMAYEFLAVENNIQFGETHILDKTRHMSEVAMQNVEWHMSNVANKECDANIASLWILKIGCQLTNSYSGEF